MGKVIPFKQKKPSVEEQTILSKLEIESDNLEVLGQLLRLKIRQGKFNRNASYAKEILKSLRTSTSDITDSFLLELRRIIENLDVAIMMAEKPTGDVEIIKNDSEYQIEKLADKMYKYIFKSEGFMEEFISMVPKNDNEVEKYYSFIGDDTNTSELKKYLIDCFNTAIEVNGITDGIAYYYLFGDYGILSETTGAECKYSDDELRGKVDVLLSSELNLRRLLVADLFDLLSIRRVLYKPADDVCNMIIKRIPFATSIELFEFDTKEVDPKGWTGLGLS